MCKMIVPQVDCSTSKDIPTQIPTLPIYPGVSEENLALSCTLLHSLNFSQILPDFKNVSNMMSVLTFFEVTF